MSKILLVLFFVVLATETGFAVKCYWCDSSTNTACADSGYKNFPAKECNVSMLTAARGSVAELVRIDYFQSGNSLPVPMVCQKIIAVPENGQRIVYRSCQLHAADTNPCEVISKKEKNMKIKIEHCSVCETDECNTAYKSYVWYPLIIFSGILGIIRATYAI